MKYIASVLFLTIWAYLLSHFSRSEDVLIFVHGSGQYFTQTRVSNAWTYLPLILSLYLFVTAEVERLQTRRLVKIDAQNLP